MRVRGSVLIVLCASAAVVAGQRAQAQEAASANLPDQFQTQEMALTSKSKKKKAESQSQTLAIAPTQNIAPVPDQTPAAAEEMPTQIAPTEDKKAEPKRNTVSMPPSQKPATPTEEPASAEQSAPVVVEKKPGANKRPRSSVQPEAASISAPVPMSLSVAQSMAISAPLPGYTYEVKRRNLTGNGICVVTVDTATGTVTNATMFQSTGSPLLDKLTIQTFKSWRFKPGTVSQVRVPISYE
jgi:TonB family protein